MLSSNFPKDIIDQYNKLNHLVFQDSKKTKTIAFVSSRDGEGTSTIAANFAMCLAADPQLTILLIDGNLRKPILHDVFDVDRENGLSDIILSETDLHSILKKTMLPNLLLITAGRHIADLRQMYKASRLVEILESQAKHVDYILFDFPPVNSYPESAVFASQCDGTILVVHAGAVRREVVRNAQQQLTKLQANILGVVLNRRKYYIPKFLYNRL